MVFPGLSVEVPMHLKVSRAARKFLDRSLEDAAAAEALVVMGVTYMGVTWGLRRLRRVAERADRGWILTVDGS